MDRPADKRSNSLTYAQAGVDIDAGTGGEDGLKHGQPADAALEPAAGVPVGSEERRQVDLDGSGFGCAGFLSRVGRAGVLSPAAAGKGENAQAAGDQRVQ